MEDESVREDDVRLQVDAARPEAAQDLPRCLRRMPGYVEASREQEEERVEREREEDEESACGASMFTGRL